MARRLLRHSALAVVPGRGRELLGASPGSSLVLLLCGLLLGGCATVRIEGSADEVEVSRSFGLLSVTLAPSTRSMVAETTSLGITNTWEGIAIGYYKGSVVALSQRDCRLVVWAEQAEQLTELRRILGPDEQICIFTEPGGN